MSKRAIFDRNNVLVVGGAGFIGSNLCAELVKTNKVICIDNFITGRVENIDRLLSNPYFKFLRHDLSQPIDLARFPDLEPFQVAFQGIQEIYTCASPVSEQHFDKFLPEILFANSFVVKNALDLAVQNKAKFLHVSSCDIYGDPLPDRKVFSESYWGFVNPVGVRTSFIEGKRFAEALVVTYSRRYGIEAKIARVFHPYGPGMSFDSGRLIPDMIRSAYNNEDVVIYGDGSEERNYCYITDVVDGFLKMMRSSEVGPVNVGNPEAISLRAIAEIIISVLQSTSKIITTDPLPGIPSQHAFPDIALARDRLSWFPVVRMEEGLQRTVKEMVANNVLQYNDFTKTQSGGIGR